MKKAQVWALNVFCEWLKYQHAPNKGATFTKNDLSSEDVKKICKMVCKFVAECRQKNGASYSPKTAV